MAHEGKSHKFVPVTRFQHESLIGTLDAINATLSEPAIHQDADLLTDSLLVSIQRHCNQAGKPWRRIPQVGCDDEETFRAVWSRGLPILIKNVRLRGDWSPTRLMKLYGTIDVRTIRVESDGETTSSTSFAHFLSQLDDLSAKEEGYSVKLKVHHAVSALSMFAHFDHRTFRRRPISMRNT